jgi:hypothetical protein
MKNILIVVVLIVLITLGGIFWYMSESGQQQDAPSPVATEPVAEPEEDGAAEPEAPPLVIDEKRIPGAPELAELPPPPLHESDAYVRDNLADAVGEANAMQYFVAEGLATRAVATVDSLGSRQVPGNIRAVAGPDDDFVAYPDPNPPTVIRNEQGDPMTQYLSDPANHDRYRVYVEMIEAIDAEQFAELYRRNEPLLEQAWRELGYTDVGFDQRLAEVIDELLATPEAEEPYRLVKPEAVYQFANEELESLSAGQKILLRMGSENAARVKSKLSEFRQVL